MPDAVTSPAPLSRLRRRGSVHLLGLLFAIAVASPADASPPSGEVRALWVVRTSLVNPASIALMVASAKASGFNTLFVQVRGRGDAFYRSSLEPTPNALAAQPESFDPLGLAIQLAHQAGIRVHAWFNLNLVADVSDMPTSRRHLVYRHPEWLMVPRELAGVLGRVDPRDPSFLTRLTNWTRGQSASVEGLYVTPLSERATDHIVEVASELVARYPVDGLHLDYARYPARTFDYSREALETFQAIVSRDLSRAERKALQRESRSDIFAYVDRFPERWQQFRRLRLTSLVRRVRAVVRERRPRALLSAAVIPDAADASSARFQDWRSWLDQRLVDAVCPMAYTTDAALFKAQIGNVRSAASAGLVWAGIGAYRLTADQTLKNISLAREAGADGIVLFSYDALMKPPHGADTLSRIGRAAFGQ